MAYKALGIKVAGVEFTKNGSEYTAYGRKNSITLVRVEEDMWVYAIKDSNNNIISTGKEEGILIRSKVKAIMFPARAKAKVAKARAKRRTSNRIYK